MALFSFRHSVKTFSTKRRSGQRLAKLGQTLSHLRYITRESAAREVVSNRLEGNIVDVSKAAEEQALGRKGRVAERFVIALPKEASHAQRSELVRSFSEELTQGKASYIAAIHDKEGNDVENPHFHLVAFDAHIRSGGRGRPRSVLGFARSNAVENAAELWANVHNRNMAGWGFGNEVMISQLSYAARGIEKLPTIHEGPAGRRLTAATKAKPKAAWKHVDSGHTRSDANDLIRQINSLKNGDANERADGLGGRIHRDARMDKKGSRALAPLVERSGGNEGQPHLPFAPNRRFDKNGGPNRAHSDTKPFQETSASVASQTRPVVASRARQPPWLRIRRPRRVFADLRFLRDSLLSTAAALNSTDGDQQEHSQQQNEQTVPFRDGSQRARKSSDLAK